jgi:hypothetical protein
MSMSFTLPCTGPCVLLLVKRSGEQAKGEAELSVNGPSTYPLRGKPCWFKGGRYK